MAGDTPTDPQNIFKFDLGESVYVIVSNYKNFVSIGIRECLSIGSHIIPTKNGLNLMVRQFLEISNNSDNILFNLKSDYGEINMDLGYNVFLTLKKIFNAHIHSNYLVIENRITGKNMELTSRQFENIVENKTEITKAIDRVFIPRQLSQGQSSVSTNTTENLTPNRDVQINDIDIVAAEKDYVDLCIIITRKLVEGLKLMVMKEEDPLSTEFTMDPSELENKITLSKFARNRLPKLIDGLIKHASKIRILFIRYMAAEKVKILCKVALHLDRIENKYLNTEEGKKIIRESFMLYIE